MQRFVINYALFADWPLIINNDDDDLATFIIIASR